MTSMEKSSLGTITNLSGVTSVFVSNANIHLLNYWKVSITLLEVGVWRHRWYSVVKELNFSISDIRAIIIHSNKVNKRNLGHMLKAD